MTIIDTSLLRAIHYSPFSCLSMTYDICPKFSYTKVSDKMAYANSAYSDQTAPEGAV